MSDLHNAMLNRMTSKPPIGMSSGRWTEIVHSLEYEHGFRDGWFGCLERVADNTHKSTGAYDRYCEIMDRDLSPTEKSILLCDMDQGALLRVFALRLEEFTKAIKGGE